MTNESSKVEIYDDESIITLHDDDNKPVEFYEIACVEHKGKFYGILQPVEEMEGLGDDEAIIFEIKRGEGDEEDSFVPATDESVLEEVFDAYLKAVSEDGGCGCGCGCEDCDDEEEEGDCDCGCGHCHHD